MLQAKHDAINWVTARIRTNPATTQRNVSRKVRSESAHGSSKARFWSVHWRLPESKDSIGSKQQDFGYFRTKMSLELNSFFVSYPSTTKKSRVESLPVWFWSTTTTLECKWHVLMIYLNTYNSYFEIPLQVIHELSNQVSWIILLVLLHCFVHAIFGSLFDLGRISNGQDNDGHLNDENYPNDNGILTAREMIYY